MLEVDWLPRFMFARSKEAQLPMPGLKATDMCARHNVQIKTK